MTDTRPNFVFIMTDQQRADYLGCTGHPVLRTPHIDSIAERGTIMNRFYVSSPVCMPNRAVFVSGLMSSVNGVRQNGNSLPYFVTTFPEVLAAEGYDTALFGKSHLQTMTDFVTPIGDNPAGSGRLANAIDIGPPEDYLWEDKTNWAENGPLDVPLPFYGFESADLVTFHGDLTGGHHAAWLAEQLDDPDALRGPDNQLPHDYECPQAVRTALPEELYSTSYVKMRTLEFLADPARSDAPFFTFVSFPDPHHPFAPPGKYWDMYDPADMPEVTDADAHENPPPHLQWVREQPFADGAGFQTDAVRMRPEHLKQAQALTCGMLTMIDDAVGEIVAMLEERGLADNTIVAFTADHGDYLGDHGLCFKGGLHFQSLIQVPMIWADPRTEQAPTSEFVASTLDLAPTILAAAQAQPYAGLQGVDLTPAFTGHDPSGRTDVLIEEQTYFQNILGFEGQVRVRTLVDERWRFTVYLGADWGELYDLTNDPNETRNLWDDPDFASVRQDLTWRLVQSQIAYSPQTPWPPREA